MNRIKIASAAIVLAAGTIGAFAFTNANEKEVVKEKTQTTYYAIKDGDGFRWTDNPSEIVGLDCQELEGASCSVLADSQPEPNTNPDMSPDNQAYQ